MSYLDRFLTFDLVSFVRSVYTISEEHDEFHKTRRIFRYTGPGAQHLVHRFGIDNFNPGHYTPRTLSLVAKRNPRHRCQLALLRLYVRPCAGTVCRSHQQTYAGKERYPVCFWRYAPGNGTGHPPGPRDTNGYNRSIG